MTLRGTFGLCCVHIAQLMSHPAIYTVLYNAVMLPVMLLGILQRVTKGQKAHISSHDGFQSLHNISLYLSWSQDFPGWEWSSRYLLFSQLNTKLFKE